MSITVIIIIITGIVSFVAFSNQELMDKLIFYPPAVTDQKQYYRFISSGFIHADMPHLLFNMFSFYVFSEQLVEPAFSSYFGAAGKILFLVMYLAAMVVSLLPTYFKNKHNEYYRSLGASGAVSAVIFAGLLISPTSLIGLFFIRPFIPGFIFGPLYLLMSYFLDKRQSDNINHSAHIWGALFGMAFLIIATKIYSTEDVLGNFIDAVKNYISTKFG